MKRHPATPRFLPAIALSASLALAASSADAQRAIGIDVSAWQGTINWTNVAKPIAQGGGGIEFAFIRSSRGGTTGTYNQSTGVGTLSMRYDDPFFVSNITQAKSKGVHAGAYHFARADILSNTGLDEANHFIEAAGDYMKPGYLRPVLDLEAGNARSTTDLTNWALAFSDRILAVTGVRPIVYLNISYANEVDSRINIHDLWLARYFSTTTTPGPYDPSVQEAIDPPSAGSLNTYGAWAPGGVYPTPRPWDFWQYGATGSVPGIAGNVDRNVANGDIEFVKEFLVPAVWNVDASGQWTTTSNWNSETYLPGVNDRVIVNRTAGSYNVTLGSGTHAIRSLQLNENLTINGGSLNITQYANLANTVTMNDGSLTSATMHHTTQFTQNGGTVTTGAVTGNGILLAYGGTFNADSVRLGTVVIEGGSLRLTSDSTSVVTSIVHSEVGSIDIGNAKLIVNYSGVNSPIDSIREFIQTGHAEGAWNGNGARSSAIMPNLGIGYVEAKTVLSPTGGTWGGVAVDGTALLITLAIKGDTNLSGTVDFDDLLAMAQGYNQAGTWINGDLNYDGTVNFDDLLSLAQNYGTSLLADGSLALTGDASSFAADWSLARSIVPEPTTMLAALPLAILTRRRR